jgi:2Fe-2S ferredoxin
VLILQNSLVPMPNIIFVDTSGRRCELEARIGETILELARRSNIPMEGACCGALSCATCHVIVDSKDTRRLPKPRTDEADMLDLALGLTPTSRLGCQVVITEALDGLTLRLPPTFAA